MKATSTTADTMMIVAVLVTTTTTMTTATPMTAPILVTPMTMMVPTRHSLGHISTCARGLRAREARMELFDRGPAPPTCAQGCSSDLDHAPARGPSGLNG
eukprot:2849942-Pyramimonas_sp.AAC.1